MKTDINGLQLDMRKDRLFYIFKEVGEYFWFWLEFMREKTLRML